MLSSVTAEEEVPSAVGGSPDPVLRRLERPQRFGDVVAEEVVRMLARGDFGAGDRLPPEPSLQRSFGVSRTVLREALKFVESRGMITIRQGRGAVVSAPSEWNLLDPLVLSAMLENHPTPAAFEQLMAVRTMLEPELAREAATAIGADDLRRLAGLLALMSDELTNPEAFLQHDVEFHDILTAAAGNMIAHSILSSIEQPLRSSRRLTNTIPHALDQAQVDHQRIYDQLAARNPDLAAAAMRDHLEWSRDHLLSRWISASQSLPTKEEQPV